MNDFDGEAKASLDQWVYFLKNSAIKDEFNAKGLKEAREILKEGRNEGEKNKALEIAREMKKNGMPPEVISKFTKLDPETIKNLQRDAIPARCLLFTHIHITIYFHYLI